MQMATSVIPPRVLLLFVRSDIRSAVTEMKPSWESFSEDEPEPAPKLKPKPKPKATPKGGKKGAATGQGDIGSYFSRKPPVS